MKQKTRIETFSSIIGADKRTDGVWWRSAGAGGQERDFGLKELKISLKGFKRLKFMFFT